MNRHGLRIAARWALLATVLAGLFLVYKWIFPSPSLLLAADAPDGRLQLIILEELPTPRPFAQSPYRYHLSLHDRASGRALPGAKATIDHDSCCIPVNEFRVEWSGASVRVIAYGRTHHGAVIDGRQHWNPTP